MTERQEFELVARAAGIELVLDPDGILRDCTGSHPLMNIFACPVWNPREDDGDSRRLQVALRMAVTYTVDDSIARVWYGDVGTDPIEELLGDDPSAATRLAVWKAALEIAKGMK